MASLVVIPEGDLLLSFLPPNPRNSYNAVARFPYINQTAYTKRPKMWAKLKAKVTGGS